MDSLLKKALEVADQAEIYFEEGESRSVSFIDGRLKEIQSSLSSGVALRIIKNKKLGFAYSTTLKNSNELLQNALSSLDAQISADYNLPATGNQVFQSKMQNYELITNEMLTEGCEQTVNQLKNAEDQEVFGQTLLRKNRIQILNSQGANLAHEQDMVIQGAGYMYPQAGGAICRFDAFKRFDQLSAETLEELKNLYQKTFSLTKMHSGKMKVLLAPNAAYLALRTLQMGLSAKNVYEKTSPLCNKIGQKIISDKLSVVDDPTNNRWPEAAQFDHEGSPKKMLNLIEQGVLKSYYNNLEYALLLNETPTGHGYKGSLYESSLSQIPMPALRNLNILPGQLALKTMIASIDRGIILEGAMGVHSGNIMMGDFSCGGSPALYVEDGKIKGRVTDLMLAGNVYEMLSQVVGVENRLHFNDFGSRVPHLLCEGVQIAIK